MTTRVLTLFVVAAGMLASTAVLAHKPSDSYLTLRLDATEIDARWDIALRDLERVVGLDHDGDGAITWGELSTGREAVFAHALARLRLATSAAECRARPDDLMAADHVDGTYAVLTFEATCPSDIRRLTIRYDLLFRADPSHRGLVRVRGPDGREHARVLTAKRRETTIGLHTVGRWAQLRDYIYEGIHHILIGLDHVLFVITLLLPAAMHRATGGWRGQDRPGRAAWDVVKLVTAFTVAHSVTLSLAALGIVTLPSRPVEVAVALSVLVLAADNLAPILPVSRWLLAFVFGLVHGFGFAGVLTELGLAQDALVVSLLGFNLGVELGQLAIVLALFPVLLVLRHTRIYRVFVLPGGSLAIAGIALWWLLERLGVLG